MEKFKVCQIQAKEDQITIGIKGDFSQTEAEFVLLDTRTQRSIIAETIRGEDVKMITFPLKGTVQNIGKFGVYLRKGEELTRIEGDDDWYDTVRLSGFPYNEKKDLYIRYFRNVKGNLTINITRARKIERKRDAEIDVIRSGENRMELSFKGDFPEKGADVRFFVVPAKQEGKWIQPSTYRKEDNTYLLNMSSFVEVAKAKEADSGKWRIYVETMLSGNYRILRLGCKDRVSAIRNGEEDFYDYREIYQDALSVYENNGLRYEIYPYFTDNGNVALFKSLETRKYENAIMNRVLDLRIRHGRLKVTIEALKNDMKIKGIRLSLRTKKEDERQQFVFPVEVKEEKNVRIVTADVNLKKVPIRPLYWDIRLMYEKNGVECATRMSNHDPKFTKKYFMSFFSKNTMKMKNREIFYPYMTVTGSIAFQCREKGEYDNYRFKIKERIAAFIYFILKPYWISKNIYLVFEKFCVMAQDNGYYFFKYCMENDIEKKLNRRIYYVMDKKSPDWDKLSEYQDRVIPFMSLKHIVYLIASKLLISTDTRDHVYAWRAKDSILTQYLDSKKLVFLQHGVIALKRVHFLYSNTRRGRCSLFITSNDMESDIIFNYFGYRKKQIAATGLCRWDVLEDHSEGLKELLVMPTWRNWLDEVSDDLFKESNYYKNYMAFLNSDELAELLEEKDYILNFYLHPKFREYIGEFKIHSDRIRLIPFGEEPLNELMMRCKLLVTDYSSVCWDVFYQGKPVIFYQFDTDEYNQAHGSYIDLETDLFGDRVETREELIHTMREYIERDFRLKEQYAKMRKNCYKYIDNHNSERICNEIIKRGW